MIIIKYKINQYIEYLKLKDISNYRKQRIYIFKQLNHNVHKKESNLKLQLNHYICLKIKNIYKLIPTQSIKQ